MKNPEGWSMEAASRATAHRMRSIIRAPLTPLIRDLLNDPDFQIERYLPTERDRYNTIGNAAWVNLSEPEAQNESSGSQQEKYVDE